MSTKPAEIELKHVVVALDRVRLNLAGSTVEKNVERLIEAAKYTLELVKKESKCATFLSH